MSTSVMTMSTGAARMLIDARLDAIDRALLGRVSRAERLDVVGEVESRIDELLRERCGPGAEPSRDDVLAVLARLDPPEAYLDADHAEPAAPRGFPPSPAAASLATPTGLSPDHRCWLSGIFGIAAAACIVMLPASYFAGMLLENELVIFGGWGVFGLMAFILGTASAVLAVLGRFRTAWGVVGAILGFGSSLISMAAILVMLAMLLNAFA